MTGNVVFPSHAGGSDGGGVAVAMSPLARAAPSYSVDAFSDFSLFAVSRMPSTSAVLANSAADLDALDGRATHEQDEELFRDLFAADNDWDGGLSGSASLGGSHGHPREDHKTKALMRSTPKAAPLWGSGVGGSPFLHTPFAPPGRTLFAPPGLAPLTPVAPTLSAPVPRLNLAELMNPRPGGDGASANVWGGGLGQVAEEDDADEQESGDDDGEERPESSSEPQVTSARKEKRAKGKARAPIAGGSSSSSAKLQQETLSFLEKLDLKALLHTPRPDVLDFYPSTSLGGSASVTGGGSSVPASHFAGRTDDPRVELEREAAPVARAKATPAKPSKKESDEISARLSHMELAYGTTKTEARKARKGTIERLANPILGYTSTLQALSPDQRRKREMALGEDGWNPCVSSPVSAKLSKKDAKAQRQSNGLDHLANSARIYEAAATLASQRLPKSSATREAAMVVDAGVAGASSNQQDDARESAASGADPLVKAKGGEKKSLSARKAALRRRIQDKQAGRSNQEASDEKSAAVAPERTAAAAAAIGATFLTQHEGEEEKLNARAKRPQPARPTLPPPVTATARPAQAQDALESRTPRRPASVRAPKSELAPQPSTGASKRADRKNGGDRERQAPTAPQRGDGAPKPSRPTGGRQQQQQQQQQPSMQQQQTSRTNVPRKPSNREGGKPSGRRPFARSRAANGAAPPPSVAKADAAPVSVFKQKSSGGAKVSAAAMLLMGSTAAPTGSALAGANGASGANTGASGGNSSRRGGGSSGRQARKAQGSQAPAPAEKAATARQSHTPRKQAGAVGGATQKDKAGAGAGRTRRASKDSAIGGEHGAKGSVTLPAITPSKTRRGSSDAGARRNNGSFRRARARAELA